jgi:hypothetical protein
MMPWDVCRVSAEGGQVIGWAKKVLVLGIWSDSQKVVVNVWMDWTGLDWTGLGLEDIEQVDKTR